VNFVIARSPRNEQEEGAGNLRHFVRLRPCNLRNSLSPIPHRALAARTPTFTFTSCQVSFALVKGNAAREAKSTTLSARPPFELDPVG